MRGEGAPRERAPPLEDVAALAVELVAYAAFAVLECTWRKLRGRVG